MKLTTRSRFHSTLTTCLR